MKNKYAQKSSTSCFAHRLISAIRTYSKMNPGKLLIIDFKTLKLIHYTVDKEHARQCVKEVSGWCHAVICEPISPFSTRITS